MTQSELAARVGIDRGYVARIETAKANPTLAVVERIAAALEVDVEWSVRGPAVVDLSQPKDLVHARCSLYVERHLRAAGLATAREVEIIHARSHGWMDLLAYDARSATMLVVEVKTRLDDLGAIERQIGWYERGALEAGRRLGWRPRRTMTWLLVLATIEADAVILTDRALFDAAFPSRARNALQWLADRTPGASGRVLAMIDPHSRRKDWLIRTRSDGRRTQLPYRSARDAPELMRRGSPRTSGA